MSSSIIEITGLATCLDNHWLFKNLNLAINKGEILAIVGGSGSGKSTLLRHILGLQQPTHGKIIVMGKSIFPTHLAEIEQARRRWGVMFQNGALFSTLTVLENVAFPLQEYTKLSQTMIEELARIKINLVGLPNDAAEKFPAALSGGMQKRAAVARALALDPELLFLDEPTAGLDPESAHALDELILTLRKVLGLTIVFITHDLDTLALVPDRIAFLGEEKILAVDTLKNLIKSEHSLIHAYFNGPRSQAIAKLIEEAN